VRTAGGAGHIVSPRAQLVNNAILQLQNLLQYFLSRASMHIMQSAILFYHPARPSVRPSSYGVVPKRMYIVKLCPPSGKGIVLVFLCAIAATKFQGGPIQGR